MVKSVNVNGSEKTTDKEVLTYYDIVEMAEGDVPEPRRSWYSITYHSKQKQGCLFAGQQVEIEPGMCFNACITSSA